MGACRLFHKHAGAARLAAALLGLAAAVSARAEGEWQSLADIRAQVSEYLQQHYRGGEIRRARVEVGRLDRRLRLKACPEPLELKLDDEARQGGSITVHTRCPGPVNWALYVPAKVAVYRPVVVATRSLGRGHRLARSDLELAERNTGQLRQGFVTELASAAGQELRRPLGAGDPVRLGLLQAPLVVERGDRVSLRAKTGNIVVHTQGTALGSGRTGEQVRVRNDSSERVVRGRITGPGEVEVRL